MVSQSLVIYGGHTAVRHGKDAKAADVEGIGEDFSKANSFQVQLRTSGVSWAFPVQDLAVFQPQEAVLGKLKGHLLKHGVAVNVRTTMW